MTAICGVLAPGNDELSGALDACLQAMSHCGPDGARLLKADSLTLGVQRRRETPEDDFDQQPMWGQHGAQRRNHCLVADLRLDNRAELANALSIPASRLRRMADSELLLEAYGRWGEACLERIVGDFAFAIWDQRTSSLFMALDPVSHRHLFYAQTPALFAFATEMEALHAIPGIQRGVDVDQLIRFLAPVPLEDGAVYSGMKRLLPGHSLRVRAGEKPAVQRWWQPAVVEPREMSETAAADELRALLEEAVRCRLRTRSDSIAILFSGGFDSTTIAGLALPHLTSQGKRLIALPSVAAEHAEAVDGDCRPWVEVAQRHFPDLDVMYLSNEERSVIDGVSDSLAMGVGRPSTSDYAGLGIFSSAQQLGAGLVLTGFGGDKSATHRGAGYLAGLLSDGEWRRMAADFPALVAERQWNPLTAFISEFIYPFLPTAVHRMRSRRRHARKKTIQGWHYLHQDVRALIGPMERYVTEGYLPGPMSPRSVRADLIRRHLVRGQTSISPPLMAAHFGMAYSTPMLDRRLLEFVLALPGRYWVRNGRNRHLMRRAFADLLPPELLTRGKKNDSVTPDLEYRLCLAEEQIRQTMGRLRENPEVVRIFDMERIAHDLSSEALRRNLGSGEVSNTAAQALATAMFVERATGGVG